jgi:hypothetical protein
MLELAATHQALPQLEVMPLNAAIPLRSCWSLPATTAAR